MQTQSDIERLVEAATQRQLPPVDERRRIRQRARVTYHEMAAALGISPATLVRWEAGQQHPSGHRAAAYGALLRRLAELDR